MPSMHLKIPQTCLRLHQKTSETALKVSKTASKAVAIIVIQTAYNTFEAATICIEAAQNEEVSNKINAVSILDYQSSEVVTNVQEAVEKPLIGSKVYGGW